MHAGILQPLLRVPLRCGRSGQPGLSYGQNDANDQFDIERRTAVRRNVNPFTLVIRRSSYASLTNDGTVLKQWRKLQCVNQILKS